MSDRTSLQAQVTELRDLLERAKDDPVLSPQFAQQVKELEQELRSTGIKEGQLFPEEDAPLPRFALFLQGGGVEGPTGIRPALAGECLIQYERMYVQQALHDEREAARTAGRQRRPRGSQTPSLLFTGTPRGSFRGSFGLEFVPNDAAGDVLVQVHAQSLRNVSDAIERISSKEESLEVTARGIAPGLWGPMKQFLKVLAQFGADLRLASSDSSARQISSERITLASERLEQELLQEKINLSGVFRGLTRESFVFDLVADGMGVITGIVDENLSDDELERIDALTNKRCDAQLLRTTLTRLEGASQESYVLLDATESDE